MEVKAAVRESGVLLWYKEMKEKQINAATVFLQGNYTFVSLPTGYGKSLIYSILHNLCCITKCI